MARHLSENDIAVIINLIDNCDGKLRWESLCEEASISIGFRPTRQTLHNHLNIRTAFSNRKKLIEKGVAHTARPQSLQVAQVRIHSLEKKNQRLEMEIALLHEKFIRWQYNAYLHGVHEDHLEKPLPPVHR